MFRWSVADDVARMLPNGSLEYGLLWDGLLQDGLLHYGSLHGCGSSPGPSPPVLRRKSAAPRNSPLRPASHPTEECLVPACSGTRSWYRETPAPQEVLLRAPATQTSRHLRPAHPAAAHKPCASTPPHCRLRQPLQDQARLRTNAADLAATARGRAQAHSEFSCRKELLPLDLCVVAHSFSLVWPESLQNDADGWNRLKLRKTT